MSLGSAEFHVTANFDEMMRGFKQAEAQARTSTGNISSSVEKMDRATQGSMKGVGMSMMHLGYIADDLQYGFRSIVNNIQPLGMSLASAFGASTAQAMAFSGAVGIVAVGINQLINHWGDLTDRLQASWSDRPVEEFKRIREAADAARAAWDKLKDAPTEMQAKSGKAMREAIVEAPAADLQKALADAIARNPALAAGQTEGERDDIRFRQNMVRTAAGPEERARLEVNLRKARERMAARILGEAADPTRMGDTARQTLQTAVRGDPGLFTDRMREAAAAADPEAVARKEGFEKHLKAQKEVDRHIKDANERRDREREKELAQQARVVREREARKKKDDDLVDQLNEQGIGGRELFDRQVEHNRKEDEHKAAKEARDKEHMAREGDARARRARHLKWQVTDIMKDAAKPQGGGEFTGLGDFWKKTQSGILDHAQDTRKKQLEALQKIQRLLEDNPDMRNVIRKAQVAVAANPP